MAKDHALKFAHQRPQITILADHAAQDRPLEELEENAVAHTADRDLLALESRLSSTFDILRHENTRCPLALAVYGDWGTGKTSAMRWLETKLKEWNSSENKNRGSHPRAYPVWFDPWRYHSREEVWRGIIAEVILGLFSVAQLNRQNFLPRMVSAAKKFGGFLGRSFLHALANLEFTASGTTGLPGMAEGEASIKASGEMFREIWDEYQKTSQPQKAYLNQFEETLRDFVKEFLRELSLGDTAPPRLVIFIDDLDRCLPAVALEVLEALKLYLSIPQLIFVVGLDQAVVNAVVTEEYRKTGVPPEKAASYLHKLFQLELRIPPSEAQMSEYMKKQIVALNQATSGYWEETLKLTDCGHILDRALIRAARNNPREVKRLLNSALIYGRNAALDLELKKADKAPRDAALRFAQGVQVLLLQRVLGEDLVNNRQVLAIGRHLEWLEQASQLVRDFLSVCEWSIETLAEELEKVSRHDSTTLHEDFKMVRAGPRQELTKSPSSPAHPLSLPPDPVRPLMIGKKTQDLTQHAGEHFIHLHEHLTSSPPDRQYPVWLHVPFLDLMQVPFSQAVAQCAPVLAPTTKSGTATPFADLPDYFRERIAQAAGVSVTDVKLENLAQITALNLADTPLSTTELRHLAAARSLKVLDLTGCTGLRSLAGLPPLPQLEKFDLWSCHGLEGNGGLAALAGYVALATLDLSFCTGLRSTQGLPPLPALKRLDLQNCTGLEGAEALQGLHGLPQLEVLDLYGCTGLRSTQGLPPLPALKTLSLEGCTGLQGAEALQGLQGLQKLEHLVLNGCTGLTRADVEALRKAFRQQRGPKSVLPRIYGP